MPPQSSHKLEADTRTEMNLSTSREKRSYKNGCDIFRSCCSAHTRVAVSSYWGWKQAPSWCRCEESCTEIRYEWWLWTEHDGLQWEWNRTAFYSENIFTVWLPLSISYFIRLNPLMCLYFTVWCPLVAIIVLYFFFWASLLVMFFSLFSFISPLLLLLLTFLLCMSSYFVWLNFFYLYLIPFIFCSKAVMLPHD